MVGFESNVGRDLRANLSHRNTRCIAADKGTDRRHQLKVYARRSEVILSADNVCRRDNVNMTGDIVGRHCVTSFR